MKNIPFCALTVMLLVDLGWVAAPVQAAEPQPLPAFSEVDKDKDGYITADEAMAVPGLTEQLTDLDRNTDGKIGREEYATLTKVAPEETRDTIPGAQME